MKLMKIATLALLLAPAMAMAADGTRPTALVVPGVMTTAGHKFASQCNDDAFSLSTNEGKLADKCQKLLAHWNAEADMRQQLRDNPRLIAVAKAADTSANLPFDTVAALRDDPFAGFGAGR